MAKSKSSGVYQLANGNWAYRIYMTLNGKKIDTTCRRDESGEPFINKTQAKNARQKRLVELRNESKEQSTIRDMKIADLWNCYLKEYSKDKATATVIKYTSLWENHVKERFGDKWASKVTVDDMYCFLLELYRDKGYAYKYVESFLKLFYQLFGIAISKECISHERYCVMFQNKGTKLHMPTITQEDQIKADTVKIFSAEEIKTLDSIFKRGNLYTAFLLGYFLGVRISECFALCWSDINWEEHTISINKQMNYEEKMFCLGAVKTYASVRTIDIPDNLYLHLRDKYEKYNQVKDEVWYRNNEIVINKLTHENTQICGGDFINRKENGELLTINSIKCWAITIEKETGIKFEYHSLRRTHITMLVDLNVPPKETMIRIGHKKYETTLKYYVKPSNLARKRLNEAINLLYTTEEKITVTINDTIIEVPEHILKSFIEQYKKVA